MHSNPPAEALSSHLFKERNDLKKKVDNLHAQLNGRDGASENILAQKRKLEDDIRTLKEENKSLRERYCERGQENNRKHKT